MAEEATRAAARPARDSNAARPALVERGQQGDREALEELYLLHFDRIYSYLHMSVGNRHDAEDLTTQTFMKMLESIKRFRWQSAPFSAWLFRIAHNLAMDHFRAHRVAGSPRKKCPEPPDETELSGGAGRVPVDRPSEHARADRRALARAAAGADAEVRLQPPERRSGDDPRTRRRARSSRFSIARSSRCRSRSPNDGAVVALEVGIVGLPSSGKSTLFHALTGARATGDVGMAAIPDPRLSQIADVDPPAQGHACCDPGRRGARHGAGATRQPAAGRRAARRARRLLRHARSRRRPRDAAARAAGRRSRPRRAAARAGRRSRRSRAS